MTDLRRPLREVAGALREAHIPFAVVGGLAVIVRGEQRLTTDVDLSVDIHSVGGQHLVDTVQPLGVIPPDPLGYLDRNRFLPLETFHDVRVDLLVATLSFEIEAIARATPTEVIGEALPVCAAEDLIIFKLVSDRPRDWGDIEGIMRREGKDLDMRRLELYVREIATDFPEVAGRFERSKKEAGL